MYCSVVLYYFMLMFYNCNMMTKTLIFMILCVIPYGLCVRCYQCASSQNIYEDTCGAYKSFDTDSNIAVDCSSDESNMPGSFCMKVVHQGPKGFIWDGRWRQVIRRCASVADTGVTGVCNWGVFDNGVYWEECYCSSDECNNSNFVKASLTVMISTLVAALYIHKLLL